MAGQSRTRWELIITGVFILPLLAGGYVVVSQFASVKQQPEAVTQTVQAEETMVQAATKTVTLPNQVSEEPIQMDSIPVNYEQIGTINNYSVAVDDETGDMLIYDNNTGLGVNTTSVEGQQIVKDMMTFDQEDMDPESKEWFRNVSDKMVKYAVGQAQPEDLHHLAAMTKQMPPQFQQSEAGPAMENIVNDPHVFPPNFPQALPSWPTLPPNFDPGLLSTLPSGTTSGSYPGFNYPSGSTLGLTGSTSGTITNPNLTTNPTIAGSGTYVNPNLTNPTINPNITNPNLTTSPNINPNITNPNLTVGSATNPNLTVNPNITTTPNINPNITNPNLTVGSATNPNLTVNPNITTTPNINPNITNPNISAGGSTTPQEEQVTVSGYYCTLLGNCD